MSPDSKQNGLTYDTNHLKKGQMVLYEGKEAKIISVNPMLVIKAEDRVICGSLRNRIKFIARHEKRSCHDGH